MTTYRAGGSFFEVPHTAVYLLLSANIVISGICFSQSGAPAVPGALLYQYGAMYPSALQRHEYWRLIAYGFLHINLIHLAINMLCLALWGGHLERRIGSLYFLIVYACGLAFGAIIGNAIHSPPYLTVGASGATSGILGALLCLWILDKIDLRANFFAINIGLNIAFALSNLRIDWGVHLGGFAAGLIACAVLDLIEKINARLLRSKFPEFVKTNFFALACACGLLLWSNAPAAMAAGSEAWVAAGAFITICLLVVKMVDVVLSLKKGLAIIVIALAISNAAVVALGSAMSASFLSLACASHRSIGPISIDSLVATACSNPVLTITTASGCALALTLLLYSQELERGIGDIGFVGASLQAERKRRQGL
jgi:membrane associated rhomboid family serine protease